MNVDAKCNSSGVTSLLMKTAALGCISVVVQVALTEFGTVLTSTTMHGVLCMAIPCIKVF